MLLFWFYCYISVPLLYIGFMRIKIYIVINNWHTRLSCCDTISPFYLKIRAYVLESVYIYRNHYYMTRSIDSVYVFMIYIIHNSTHVLYIQIQSGVKWCWKSIKSICHQSDLLLMDLKFSRNINFSLRTKN